MYLRSCDHAVIVSLVLVDIYTFEVVITVLSPIFTCKNIHPQALKFQNQKNSHLGGLWNPLNLINYF